MRFCTFYRFRQISYQLQNPNLYVKVIFSVVSIPLNARREYIKIKYLNPMLQCILSNNNMLYMRVIFVVFPSSNPTENIFSAQTCKIIPQKMTNAQSVTDGKAMATAVFCWHYVSVVLNIISFINGRRNGTKDAD